MQTQQQAPRWVFKIAPQPNPIKTLSCEVGSAGNALAIECDEAAAEAAVSSWDRAVAGHCTIFPIVYIRVASCNILLIITQEVYFTESSTKGPSDEDGTPCGQIPEGIQLNPSCQGLPASAAAHKISFDSYGRFG